MGVASGNRGTWNNRGTAGPRGAGDGGLCADGLQQGSRGPDRKRRVLARGRGAAAAAVLGVLPAAGRHILVGVGCVCCCLHRTRACSTRTSSSDGFRAIEQSSTA